MQRFWALAGLCLALLTVPVRAETLLVLPLFNASRTPNLDWIGESVSEALQDALASEGQIALGREERAEAYRRLAIRPYTLLTRASVMKLGEALDADQVIFGEFTFEAPPAGTPLAKGSIRITVRILDLKRLHAGNEYIEIGALEDLAALQNHLAWQTLQFLTPKTAPSEAEYVRAHPPVRVDAVENFIRGLLASSDEQKQKLFAQAARLDARYSAPCFRLGQHYWERKNYKVAGDWLAKVTPASVHYREANFFLGLCRYYTGDYAAAKASFESVAATVPLNEVWNNLGAAQLRAGDPEAALASFRKALEGDSGDPDYHFNVGYALLKQGRYPQAADSFKAALQREPEDEQAKQMLERAVKATPLDLRAGAAERVKLSYEETAYLQLKAMFDKK
jgi:tetratricopeptide (TPR) repeat protein